MHNMVMLIGRLNNEIEIKEDGTVVMELAVQRLEKNEQGEYDVDIIDLVAPDGLTKNCIEYLKKGDLVGVKGQLFAKVEEGHEEMYVKIEKLSFLSSKKVEENGDE